MGILGWIVVGILAGVLAKAIMPGDQDLGILMTMALGIVGAILGGWVMSMITGTGITGFDLRTILVATVGALAVLAIVGMVRRRSALH
ncbi:MAG: GlsB/YeaQ/YmgE family stress response membrane protein [Coriobacteriia bacterium]